MGELKVKYWSNKSKLRINHDIAQYTRAKMVYLKASTGLNY